MIIVLILICCYSIGNWIIYSKHVINSIESVIDFINLEKDIQEKNRKEESYKNPIFVITQTENSNKIKYYKINKTNNYEKTKPFISDPVSTYFIYGCTESYVDNEKGKILNRIDEKHCEIERENQKVEITQDFKNIINAITDLEHDIWDKKILKHRNNYYLVISLNVNLSSPYDLYKYDKETKKLIKICEFYDEDVMGIKIKE